MTAYLLHTKLCVPPLRSDLVSRPRLIERLNQGLSADQKLILSRHMGDHGRGIAG